MATLSEWVAAAETSRLGHPGWDVDAGEEVPCLVASWRFLDKPEITAEIYLDRGGCLVRGPRDDADVSVPDGLRAMLDALADAISVRLPNIGPGG